MTAGASALTARRSLARTLAWLAAGGLAAGTLDILYVILFWAAKGVPGQRILQSVAAGVLGEASFDGGRASALLGLALHFAIALCMAAAYFIAARALPWLHRAPIRYGALYGLLLYAVMQYIVVPLSAAPGGGTKNMVWIVASIVAHVVLVGIPIAWCARRGAS
jgi:hypothetical protein